MKIRQEDLSKKTNIGIGPIVHWVDIEDDGDFALFADYANRFKKSFWIGNGSNLLVSNEAKKILFVHLSGSFNSIEFDGKRVVAGAGSMLCDLIAFYKKHLLTGLEFLSGIPATVGGAISMNAGAYGDAILNHVVSIRYLKAGKIITSDLDSFNYGYRRGPKKKLLSAEFRVRKCDIEVNSMRIIDERRKKQPLGRSFGSVFKNPQGVYAGRLIEECGLKGKISGGAIISEKHANFIINRSNASFVDVYNLISQMEEAVFNRFNIILEREVKIV